MRDSKKPPVTDDDPGAPEWMVTFSDCMTLLLTFFVLLLSFASFDNQVFSDLRVIYSDALTTIAPVSKKTPKDALRSIPPIRHVKKILEGSETPTKAEEFKEGLMDETDLAELKGNLVFIIPSKELFWGNGRTLSREGRNVMDLMASFLKEVPGRIVVSETGPAGGQNNLNFGLPRAWVILEYLTKSQGVDRKRFSLSLPGIVSHNSLESNTVEPEPDAVGRIVQLTILERSTYN
ncbi:MAG: hypothetical protein JXM79_11920 [Sedimentisphaerales bacterium]|nr:hypothetical protein [Sedimentisphaerales bacterium]